MDEDGMNLDILEQQIAVARQEGKTLEAIYVIPDFQNPTGITMSLEKRGRLLDIARREELLVIEDSPYSQLRFAGEMIPTIWSLDTDGRVITLMTFSKVLSAGLRLGVLFASDSDLMDVLVRMKQATDLCTSKLTQHMAARYINEYGMDEHLRMVRTCYRKKCDMMIAALERYMPQNEGITWTHPDGGLFLWVCLPDEIDTGAMFPRAIENKVAYVAGSGFYPNGGGENAMRLSFSLNSEAKIDEGIRRLAKVVREELATKRVGASV